MKKLFFTTIMALAILIPLVPANAQYDQRCWLEKKYGSQLGCEDYGGVFYHTEETAKACGGEEYIKDKKIGFCQAVGDAETAVSFGGKTKFANFGEFIKFMYNYGIGIAGILAVIMIIIAGAQWILSGGNAERITSAKKRISGAIVGLLLAVLSYSILNTVNPYLINLRLPQIWMINRQELAPPTCDDIEGKRFAFAANPGERVNKNTFSQNNLKEMKSEDLKCGNEYFVEGAAGQTCTGTFCSKSSAGKPQICGKLSNDSYRKCHEASVMGEIYNSSPSDKLAEKFGEIGWAGRALFGEGWSWPWAEEPTLYVICKDGDFDSIGSIGEPDDDDNPDFRDDTNLKQTYFILAPDDPLEAGDDAECSGTDDIRGFALYLEFDEIGDPNDEEHLIGVLRKEGEAGKTQKVFEGIDLGEDESGDYGSNFWNKDSINGKDSIDNYLITVDDLKRGITINIDANKVCDIDQGDEQGHGRRVNCYGEGAPKNGLKDLGYR